MRKLFITDLDGTALGGNYPVYTRFPECFASLLDELTVRGWNWAINSSWDIAGQWKLVQDSPVKSRPAYLIGEFGREIAQLRGGKPELLQPYCADQELRIREFTLRKIIPLQEKLNRKFLPEKIHFYGHLFQYIARDETGMKAFAAKYENDPELRISSSERQIIVRPAFLDKGKAVREIMQRERIKPEDIVTAGDEAVDLSMMTPDITLHPICPANAAESVQTFVRNAGGKIAVKSFGAGISEEMRLLLQGK